MSKQRDAEGRIYLNRLHLGPLASDEPNHQDGDLQYVEQGPDSHFIFGIGGNKLHLYADGSFFVPSTLSSTIHSDAAVLITESSEIFSDAKVATGFTPPGDATEYIAYALDDVSGEVMVDRHGVLDGTFGFRLTAGASDKVALNNMVFWNGGGGGGQASIASDPALDYFLNTNHAWSMSVWDKPSDPIGAGFSYFLKQGMNGTISFDSQAGKIHLRIQGTFGGDSIDVSTQSNLLTQGVMSHIAVAYDGSKTAAGVKIWFNGTLQLVDINSDGLTTDDISEATGVTIRQGGDREEYLDEFRIMKGYLSQAQVDFLYNSGNGTVSNLPSNASLAVLYWKLDETSGTTAADSAAGHHDGTVQGGVSFDTDVPSLLFPDPRSYAFDGAGASYVNVPNDPILTPAGSLTLSAWIKIAAFGPLGTNYSLICGKQNSSNWLHSLIINSSTHKVSFWMAGNMNAQELPADAFGALSLNTWYHVAGVYDAGMNTIAIYVNGAFSDSSSLIGIGSRSTGDPFNIGGNSFGYPYQGKIDDVRLYDIALSSGQIASLASGANV